MYGRAGLSNVESGAYGLRLTQTDTVETYAATTLPAALVKRHAWKKPLYWRPGYLFRRHQPGVTVEQSRYLRFQTTGLLVPEGDVVVLSGKPPLLPLPTTATALTVRAVLDTAGGAAGNCSTFDRLTLTAGTIPQDFY